jgi:hypothetical protein
MFENIDTKHFNSYIKILQLDKVTNSWIRWFNNHEYYTENKANLWP